METAKFNPLLEELLLCGRPASHPLLLPVLVLCRELSSENDEKQRAQRKELRKLENALSSRYQVKPAARYGTETDLELDRISTQIANCQCEVLQKRPQAWQNVVCRVKDAALRFWYNLSEEKKDPALRGLHDTLLSRLEFLTVKLEGIENYAFVTLERLNIHREVVSESLSQTLFVVLNVYKKLMCRMLSMNRFANTESYIISSTKGSRDSTSRSPSNSIDWPIQAATKMHP